MKSTEEVQWEAEARRRVAYHEAGHAAMAYTVGRSSGLVSIRPGEHHSGIAFHGGASTSQCERGKLGLPVPLLPARLRRVVETEILILLAGREAEFLRWIPPSGYSADPDDDAAVGLAREVVASTLSVRESESLAAAEREELPVDQERAERLAWVAVGPDAEAGMYLSWLHMTTRNLVGESGFLRLVEALVPELLRHEVLGGRVVRRILDSARQRRYGAGGRVRPGGAPSELAAAADRENKGGPR